VPDIPRLGDFAGEWFHTGTWPHGGVDVAGKRVGMIGTGSTGIQAAPVLAEGAAHLTVFQRTANYSIPARNRPLDDAFKAWAKANAAGIRVAMRATRGRSANAPPMRWTMPSARRCTAPPGRRAASRCAPPSATS
jgi:cyclohexanone monooxygenase